MISRLSVLLIKEHNNPTAREIVFFEPDFKGIDFHAAMMKGLCDRRNRRTRSVQFSNLKPAYVWLLLSIMMCDSLVLALP